MSVEDAKAPNNADYLQHHPDAISDVDVAFDIGRATKDLEDKLSDWARQTIDLATQGRVDDVERMFRYMESEKAKIDELTNLVTSTHAKVKEIQGHHPSATTEVASQ